MLTFWLGKSTPEDWEDPIRET